MDASSLGAGKRPPTLGQKLGKPFTSLARRMGRPIGDPDRRSAIIDATPDLVAGVAPDGRLPFLNRAGRKALGLGESDDPRDLNLFDHFAPWARDVVVRAAFPAAAREGAWVGETALLDGKGGEIPLSRVMVAHRGADGEVSRCSILLHDISSRRAMENRLAESPPKEGRQSAPPRGAGEDFCRTLLLVDDEDNILSALTRLLRRDGYRILRANSGEEGLNLLATHEVGVIVSDQRMPGMSGVDFLRRAKDLYPDTIRIVLSGYTELNSVTEAINEGSVYKFLTKPWEDEQLRAHIQEAFQRHELKRENALLARQLTEANRELREAKLQLERRVAEKTLEATRSLGVLEVSREMLEILPVAVLGVDEEGLVAVANRLADQLFATASGVPLAGALAAERLPAALTDSITRVLQGDGPAHGTWRDGGRETEYWCHAMGLASLSRGAILVVAPFKEG